jgi:hypothetical protein
MPSGDAFELTRAGVDVAIVERRASPELDSSAVLIRPDQATSSRSADRPFKKHCQNGSCFDPHFLKWPG